MSVVAIVVVVIVVLGLITISLAGAAVRVLREYERGIVFRLGRVLDVKGPGLILLIPAIDRLVRVGLRTVTLNIPPQDLITRDNVPARVNAVAYFRIVDADKAVLEIEDVMAATSQVAQTTLRSVLGKAELDTLLSERERLNDDLQQIIDTQTEPWGVKVMIVEIKDVEIPGTMQRAMARQAEAERERRAKVINAEGEFQASAKLADAADVISQNPTTIQLRYLQSLREIGGGDRSSTIVFPLPIDVVGPLVDAVRGDGGEGEGAATRAAAALRRAREAADRTVTEGPVAPGALPEGAGSEPEGPEPAARERSEGDEPGERAEDPVLGERAEDPEPGERAEDPEPGERAMDDT